MTLTVETIMTRALVLLKDKGAVRWPAQELLGWINEGVRYAVSVKPDLGTQRVDVPLSTGAQQNVPDTIKRILRYSHNTVSKSAVTPTTAQLLDAYVRNWRGATLGTRIDVRHVVVDEVDDRAFYVVPPNNGAGSINVTAVMRLDDLLPAVTDPDSPASYSDVDSPITDVEGDALVDYLVYRAAAKDTDLPGMAQRSAAHFQAFAQRIGMEVQQETNVRPEIPAPDPTL